jgi:hypothetical protein
MLFDNHPSVPGHLSLKGCTRQGSQSISEALPVRWEFHCESIIVSAVDQRYSSLKSFEMKRHASEILGIVVIILAENRGDSWSSSVSGKIVLAAHNWPEVCLFNKQQAFTLPSLLSRDLSNLVLNLAVYLKYQGWTLGEERHVLRLSLSDERDQLFNGVQGFRELCYSANGGLLSVLSITGRTSSGSLHCSVFSRNAPLSKLMTASFSYRMHSSDLINSFQGTPSHSFCRVRILDLTELLIDH